MEKQPMQGQQRQTKIIKHKHITIIYKQVGAENDAYSTFRNNEDTWCLQIQQFLVVNKDENSSVGWRKLLYLHIMSGYENWMCSLL